MLPCIFYIVMLILLLYYPAHSLGVTVSIKKRSQQFIHALLTSYIIHFIYFAASQTSFPSLNTISCPPGIRPLSYLHRLPLRWTAPPKFSRQLLILYFFTQILFPSFIFYLLFDSINAIMYIE